MGTNKANPTAMILSSTMMLRHLGFVLNAMGGVLDLRLCLYSLDHLANKIASATFDTIDDGKVRTADMGGTHRHLSTAKSSRFSCFDNSQALPQLLTSLPRSSKGSSRLA